MFAGQPDRVPVRADDGYGCTLGEGLTPVRHDVPVRAVRRVARDNFTRYDRGWDREAELPPDLIGRVKHRLW